MAKGIQIPIEVVDKFSKQLADMDARLEAITKRAKRQSDIFTDLGKSIVSGLSVAAMVDFGRASIQAFSETEAGNNRLQVAMRNLGVYTKAAYERNLEFSESLQRSTAYSNDEVTAIQTKLTSFGLYGVALAKTTKLTLDLAAGQKISAEEAAQLVGKAYVGQTGALSRLGIQFTDTGDRARTFDSIQRGLQTRYGGSAAAELGTYAGQVKALGNSYDDLKKRLGADLVPLMLKFVEAANKGMDALDRNAAAHKASTEMLSKESTQLAISLAATEKYSTAQQLLANEGYQKSRKELEALLVVEKEKAALDDKKVKAPPAPIDQEAAAREAKRQAEVDDAEWTAAETARIKAEGVIFSASQLKDIEAQRLAEELEQFGNHAAAKQVLDARVHEKERALNQARIANVSSTLNFISTLQHAKSKELVAIGKAAAIIDTTIHTAVAVMGAYRAFSWIPAVGPALGAAAAAMVATAGAAQIAMIGGLQLKEGGFVPGSAGGVQATIGEAGRDEAVIPLQNAGAMRRIGQAIADAGGAGGRASVVNLGGITINIAGGVPGDAAGRRSMVAELAEEIRRGASEAIELSVLTVQTANRYQLRAV